MKSILVLLFAAATLSAQIGPQISARNVLDFDADNTGATDNLSAFTQAATWANAGSGRTLVFPDGTYKYSGGLAFTEPVTLTGGGGAVLNYTGSAHAVDMGPAGLTVSVYQSTPYQVMGLTFSGGASMTEGIYFNPFIVTTFVRGTRFLNFGNATAWNIFYQSDNWYNLVDGVVMYSSAGFGRQWNGIRNNGARLSGTADNGQSRTIIANTILQTFDVSIAGTGVYLNSLHAILQQSTVSGFGPAVQLGPWANDVLIDHLYTETPFNTTAAVILGDTSGPNAGAWNQGVTIANCNVDVHNVDFGTTAHFIAPVNSTQGFQSLRLLNNAIANLTGGQPLVVQNNLPGQSGNAAWGNQIIPTSFVNVSAVASIHTTGASIAAWNGTDDQFTLLNPTDAQEYMTFQAGLTADQYEGFLFLSHTGAELGQISMGADDRLHVSMGVGTIAFYINTDGSVVFGSDITVPSSASITAPDATTGALYLNGVSGQMTALLQIDVPGTGQVFSVSPAGVISSGGAAGFTGTKTAGTCVLTITGGIITNVTGC